VSSHQHEQALQERIGYQFTDIAVLRRALTHGSFGDGRPVADNERMEFLGDRILGLIVADYLFEASIDAAEGQMARQLNTLVCKEACAKAAIAAGVGEALYLSKAEEKNGGRQKASILGDACEALLAALYLDGGMIEAQRFFKQFWAEQLANISGTTKDPKSSLQEWALANQYGLPIYTQVGRVGPDHRPEFQVSVELQQWSVTAKGNSKQHAETAAAEAMLEQVVKKT